MTPSEIKAALVQLGGRVNKRLGQHFLIDKAALEVIVNAADVKKGDRILEIGPGLGVLTDALCARGAEVIAIEQDRRFVEFLNSPDTLLVRGGKGGVTVIHGDASRLDWENHLEDKDWKFVSNLPYSITSLALRKALYAKHPPTNIVVLVQREVAERAVGRNSERGARSDKPKQSLLSLMVAFASHEARIVKRVAAGAFYPPPKVESAILRIIPMTHEERLAIWGVDPEKVMAVARRGFAHPRKLLASNLGVKGYELQAAGIAEKARAEDLLPDDWVRLHSLL